LAPLDLISVGRGGCIQSHGHGLSRGRANLGPVARLDGTLVRGPRRKKMKHLIKFGTPPLWSFMSTSASHAELAEDDVGPSTPPSSSTASTPLCPICCEEDAAVVLSACQHRSCRACLVRDVLWSAHERGSFVRESSGRDTGPTCPFCRMAIHDGDILRVMGRTFCPLSTLTAEQRKERQRST
jgi:hypothetical protein